MRALPGAAGPGTLPAPPMPFVDGLTFLSDDPDDIAASGLTAFVLDVSDGVWVEGPEGNDRYTRTYEACAASIRAIRERLQRREVGRAFLATRGSDIARAWRDERTAIFFQFQGAEPIGRDLDRLREFHELGLRVLQITHHRNNAWGGGALEPRWSGLTDLGFRGIEALNELGIVPDLSHVSDPSCHDVLDASSSPVIISHGAARAIVPNARCTPDDVIRRVGDSGGVMGVFMMSFWLTREEHPTTEAYIRQIRHVANVGGIDAVGIANDYTVAGHLAARAVSNDNARAVEDYLPWWNRLGEEGILGFEEPPRHLVIPELNHTRRMFDILDALDRNGFHPDEIEKIMGRNWTRVLTEALP